MATWSLRLQGDRPRKSSHCISQFEVPDWPVVDTASILERAAARRYALDPAARPSWWRPYPLPLELAALQPNVHSQFFASGPSGRTRGGLFGLDGIHPTTIPYGVLAQEFINVMAGPAGVSFRRNGGLGTSIDFASIIRMDTLINDPPVSIDVDMEALSWLNATVDLGKPVAALCAF